MYTCKEYVHIFYKYILMYIYIYTYMFLYIYNIYLCVCVRIALSLSHTLCVYIMYAYVCTDVSHLFQFFLPIASRINIFGLALRGTQKQRQSL